MENPTLEQDSLRNPDGTLKQGAILNPTGKGGLQERPEDINFGGRPKNSESFAYWYRAFKDMTVKELKEWQHNNPEETRTVASDLAFTRMVNAKKDLKEYQEIADRSEGKAVQTMKHEGDLITGIKVEIVDGTNSESNEGI
jgi:hypothetical protein